jgi:hypothetical protein
MLTIAKTNNFFFFFKLVLPLDYVLHLVKISERADAEKTRNIDGENLTLKLHTYLLYMYIRKTKS